MSPERIYRNESGEYEESELAILVWMNPNLTAKPNSRLLATMTDKSSPNPVAFPIRMLRSMQELLRSAISTDESLVDDIQKSTQDLPAIIPIPLARSHLGWTEFFIPTRYLESR
jgi:hypothetical protein